MLCDKCHVNPATIELDWQMNHHHEHLHICQDCYNKMRADAPHFNIFGGSSFDDLLKGFFSDAQGGQFANGTPHVMTESPHRGGRGGLLDQLGKNLTAEAQAGKIDPVIGREKEIERVIETLNRRNKNNPVLIGDPGVGKTAIAEGLALRIVEGKVPAKLRNKQIYVLDMASLVAGTGIRGQFEQRMQQLIREMQQRSDVIVFIDEIHQIVGAGSAEGSQDAGNILKPALARGDIQIIGATTLKEYRKIEKDAALERRFQPIIVNEPTIEQAIAILNGLKKRYEDYHEVTYTDEAIRACVTLSNRYIQDRYLPDKAIDLMDEAGAKLNLRAASENETELEAQLEAVLREKETATRQENYERAAQLRDEEQSLRAKIAEVKGQNAGKAVVNKADIEALIEEKTGIPVRRLEKNEQEKMKNLESRLNAKVIGQAEAVKKVAKAIRRNRAGFRRHHRPIGSFLFVGPTGVGKTELSKTLAEELFGDREAMIRLDMSEYMEKHSVSKLIGSPPGYVGHEEAGQLTEKVRRKPYSLILLDEVEKAHPDVMNMFLQILEDGRLTDSQGRTVSFKDTVIIMTSNAGQTDVKPIKVGFGQVTEEENKNDLLDRLKDYFRPEFLNRFDAIVAFSALSREDLKQIVELMLKDVYAAASEQGITVTVTDAAKEKLAELGYHPAFGARPLRRVIEEKVEDGIAELMMEENNVKAVVVDVDHDDVVVKTA